VEAWCAGRNNHPVEVMLHDVIFDHLLAGLRAGVLVLLNDDDIGKCSGVLGDSTTINGSGNVQATVTDIDSDSEIFLIALRDHVFPSTFLIP
jgi:hypothetical protein